MICALPCDNFRQKTEQSANCIYLHSCWALGLNTAVRSHCTYGIPGSYHATRSNAPSVEGGQGPAVEEYPAAPGLSEHGLHCSHDPSNALPDTVMARLGHKSVTALA